MLSTALFQAGLNGVLVRDHAANLTQSDSGYEIDGWLLLQDQVFFDRLQTTDYIEKIKFYRNFQEVIRVQRNLIWGKLKNAMISAATDTAGWHYRGKNATLLAEVDCRIAKSGVWLITTNKLRINSKQILLEIIIRVCEKPEFKFYQSTVAKNYQNRMNIVLVWKNAKPSVKFPNGLRGPNVQRKRVFQLAADVSWSVTLNN